MSKASNYDKAFFFMEGTIVLCHAIGDSQAGNRDILDFVRAFEELQALHAYWHRDPNSVLAEQNFLDAVRAFKDNHPSQMMRYWAGGLLAEISALPATNEATS